MTHHPQVPAFAADGNWLLPSIGAKVDLACRMRNALRRVGKRLYVADCSPLSAAFSFADGYFLLPRAGENRFQDALLEACREHDIHVVLPSRDADLLYYSMHFREFVAAQLWPIVSPVETIIKCQDKIAFHEHCIACRLPVLPRFLEPEDGDFPCFVRPRVGAGGIGAAMVRNRECLVALYGLGPWPDLLIQPLCDQPEYSIDVLFGPGGEAVQWVARERIQVKAGESCISRTVSIPVLDALIRDLAQALPFFGPVTVQAFYSTDHGAHLIEVNPRWGGASSLGVEAGLRTPERLVALVEGDMESFMNCGPIQSGITMLRYSSDLFVSGGKG